MICRLFRVRKRYAANMYFDVQILAAIEPDRGAGRDELQKNATSVHASFLTY